MAKPYTARTHPTPAAPVANATATHRLLQGQVTLPGETWPLLVATCWMGLDSKGPKVQHGSVGPSILCPLKRFRQRLAYSCGLYWEVMPECSGILCTVASQCSMILAARGFQRRTEGHAGRQTQGQSCRHTRSWLRVPQFVPEHQRMAGESCLVGAQGGQKGGDEDLE